MEAQYEVHSLEEECQGAHSLEAQDESHSLESNLDGREGLEEAVSFSSMSPGPGWKSSQASPEVLKTHKEGENM